MQVYLTRLLTTQKEKKSNEVNLYDGRKSIEFVTAVYKSFNEDKNIILPIEKESIYYKSWIPKKYNKN